MSDEREVLDVLTTNARESTADIAAQTGLDEDAVEEAIASLERRGVVHGYQAVVDWDRAGTDRVRAIVELNVELDRETGYEEIADRIAKFPAVEALHLVSGDYDFAAEVAGDSMQDVSGFVSEQVAPIPEITQTVTHYVMETYKDGGVRFGDRDEDDRLSVSP
ncbi:Lrp/AsnC family transcriptional regulator [Halopenitus persicus]|uniref:DNA-binding transcriptional regulator, Lrp family n=1 Tax=Halopenitus persicus TaxID=1048396 RepID=A0A1H3K3K8_9EURY|nr:Lrp/AsnC family transcriptional regulator [Halopenitus persicus]QHS15665.1 Lrp/AsnC family transcriptional regulator [haloarchaeon 3A1-DGR]SDY46766.1 DNA-binding transcriptional regulator, Lrp family [Halopenitus persicus]